MQMTGNTVLVTGGGSGIGQGLAGEFLARGNDVVIAARADKALAQTLAADPQVRSVALDQADARSIATFADEVRTRHPDVNILINNAGIQTPEDLTQGKTGAAEAQIITNLLGPIRVTAALLSQLMSMPHAAIINVSSGLGFVPSAGVPTYSATKAAVHAYTRSLRFQLRDTRVQVIEVVPPYVQTNLQRHESNDPSAMPLDDFVAEVMKLLTDEPEIEEVLVDKVKAFQFAERDGTSDQLFAQMNERAAQASKR